MVKFLPQSFLGQNSISLDFPYEDDLYDPTTDYREIVYSLKVIGAVQAIAAKDLQEVLSKDAVLSIGLAAYALAHNA